MPHAKRSPDPPLICQRRFEAHRMQQELWAEAYQQLVPQRRQHRQAAGVVRRGRKPVNGSGETSTFPNGRCA
jgi:hypothetical protein